MPIFLPEATWLERVALPASSAVAGLAAAVWPGALTLILRRNPDWCSAAVPGDTVALRIPRHPVAESLLRETGEPITGSSANARDEPAALTAEAAQQFVGKDVITLPSLDLALGGTASTMLDLAGSTPRIVRQGAVAADVVAQLVSDHLEMSLDRTDQA